MKQTYGIEVAVKELRVTTTVTLDTRILNDACVALDQAAGQGQASVRSWDSVLAGRFMRVAAVVALVAAVAVVALVLWMGDAEETRSLAEKPGPTEAPETPDAAMLLAREKADIEALFGAANVDGLVAMLEDGLAESKMLTAAYLGQIGDARAIPALSRLAAQWSTRPKPGANPFLEAIEQINARVQPREPNAPDPNRAPSGRVVPEARPASVLTGKITDRDTRELIEDVVVRVVPSGGGRGYEATSDSNGVYVFAAVGADGTYSIRPVAPEHITPAEWDQPRETIDLRRGRKAVKDYTLARGAGIHVTAVDEAGKPVNKVRIYAAYVADDMGRGPKRPVRTRADGAIAIGGLRPDRYWVTAAHRDYASAGQAVLLEEPGQIKPLTFVLEKGIDVIGVATCSDGLPASGWQIEARPAWWHSLYCAWDYPIAEDGSFVLEHVLPGSYELGIQIPDDDGGSRGICAIDANLPPETEVLDLGIPKPSPHGRVRISGIVRFVDGEYDRGFWIHAYSDAGHSGSVYLERGQRQFTLDSLVPGLYDIYTKIVGARHDFLNVKAPSERIVLEIQLNEAVSLRATVVDKETSQPVTQFRYRPFGQQQWHEVQDSKGVFEITTRGPDVAKVMIKADGYGDKVAALSPDANEPTVIEMGASLALAGTVVDEVGQPVAGATVSYRYRGFRDASPDDKYITTTDAHGYFIVEDVPPGDAHQWFVFRHPEYARSMPYLKVRGAVTTEAKVVLKRGGAVEGIVHDEQGTPMPHTRLFFMDENEFSYWKENRGRLGEVTTDESGHYRIEHLPEELCYAFRDDPDNQLGVVHGAILPEAGRTRRLDIGGPWKTSGRLLAGGEPMGNFPLKLAFHARYAQGFEAYARTDSLGRFTFHGIPTGRRSIYWVVPGQRNSNRWNRLGTFDFIDGADLDLRALEVTRAQVAVELVSEDPDAPLELWDVVLREYHDMHFSGRRVGRVQPRTDHADLFVFSDLRDGRYEAIAEKEGHPCFRKAFEVAAGQSDHAIVLTVPTGSGVIVGTLEAAGSDQSLPSLLLRSQDQRITADVEPDAGTFALENLPPGEYAIGLASAARARTSTLTTVRLEPGEHKEVRVRLDMDETNHFGDGYLVVLVVTEAGLPSATPDVWLERDGQIIVPHFNNDDGKSFSAPPGMYVLHAEYPGFVPLRETVEIRSRQGRTRQEIFTPLVVTMRRR